MSAIRYGQSGYDGFSKSNRAVQAEVDGKLPLSRAMKAVAAQAAVSQKEAREALVEIGPCEWHHTSKYALLAAGLENTPDNRAAVVALRAC